MDNLYKSIACDSFTEQQLFFHVDGSDLILKQNNMVVQLQPAYMEFNFPILIMREDVELGIYFWLIIAAAFHDLGITLLFEKKTLQYAAQNSHGLLTGLFSFEHWPSFT